MIGLTLGIASALCWAGLDVARKALAREASPTALAVFLLFGQLPLLGAWAAVDRTWVTDTRYWPPALASMALNALANVLFMRSVRLSPLSRTVPLLSLTPVFGALAAMPLLREVPGLSQWAGILLVVLGALILNSGSSGSWWRSLTHERGALPMIAVALLWALSTALDKRALPHAAPASHAFLLCFGSAVILMSWILGAGQQAELGRVLGAPKALLGVMVGLAVAALALQMMALQWLWVAMLETLKRALGVLGSVALGRVFFLEPIDRRKQAAALFMVAGTVLLALS